MATQRRHLPPARGMTLMEIMIAMVVAALAMTIAIPSLNNLTRAKLRSETNRLGSYMRYVYDFAVTQNLYCKVVFNLDGEKQTFHTECTEDADFIPAEKKDDGFSSGWDEEEEEEQRLREEKARAAGDTSATPPSDSLFSQTSFGPSSSILGFGNVGAAGVAIEAPSLAKLGKRKPKYVKQVDELTKPVFIDEDIAIDGVWTGGRKEEVTEGSVTVLFFPSGFVQPAVIHLRDVARSDAVMTIQVEPLSGKVKVTNGFVEAPVQ